VTRTTDSYQSLHRLTPAQVLAVTSLAGGATHQEAAEAAGVHRVTVTRWTKHHPEVIAELNRIRADAAIEAHAQVVRVSRAALGVIEDAVRAGSVDAAFKWLRIVPLAEVTTPPTGPLESAGVVDYVRLSMPSLLEELLWKENERKTSEAERLIVDRLKLDEQ
jgi:hypothetical protein